MQPPAVVEADDVVNNIVRGLSMVGMLDGWYGALTKRLQAPADAAEQDAGANAPLPAPVIRAAKALWGRALQHSDERASAQFPKADEDLNNQVEALRLAQEALAQDTERLSERSEGYVVAMQAKDAQIAEQGRLVQELQQQLASNQEMLAAARSKIVQLRLAVDADRRRHDANEVEHQAERTRLEGGRECGSKKPAARGCTSIRIQDETIKSMSTTLPLRSMTAALTLTVAVLGLGYVLLGTLPTIVFATGYVGGFACWLWARRQLPDFHVICAAYWLTLALFVIHKVEERRMDFFPALAELTGHPVPQEISPLGALLYALASAWLLVPVE